MEWEKLSNIRTDTHTHTTPTPPPPSALLWKVGCLQENFFLISTRHHTTAHKSANVEATLALRLLSFYPSLFRKIINKPLFSRFKTLSFAKWVIASANKMCLKRKNGVSLWHPTLQPLFENKQTYCQIIDLLSAQRHRHRFSLLCVVCNRHSKNVSANLHPDRGKSLCLYLDNIFFFHCTLWK